MVGPRLLHSIVALGVLVASPATAQEDPVPPSPSETDPRSDAAAPDSPSDATEPEPPPEQPPPVAPVPPAAQEPTTPPNDGPPVAAFPDESTPPPPPPAPRPTPTPPPAASPRVTPPPSSSSRTATAPTTAPPPTTPPTPAAPSTAGAQAGEHWSTSERDSRSDRDDDRDHRALRLGPIVGAGLPNLISFGGQLKLTRFLGAGINIGLIPTVQIDYYGQATLKYQEYDVYGHLYPFGNSIFLGAGVGYATVTGIFTETVDLGPYGVLDPSLPASLELRSEGSVQTMVLTPQAGLFKTFKSGFSVGFDVGAQIPIAPSDVKFKTKVPGAVPQPVIDQYVEPNDEEVRSTLNKIGQTPLPTINLRLGWLL